MSFKTVYIALYNQIVADSTLLAYMDADDFKKGFKDALPSRKYMVILEPGPEVEPEQAQDYGKVADFEYEIQVYCRMILALKGVSSTIVGTDSLKGILDFSDDVKDAVRKDRSLGYDSKGYSVSAAAADDNFLLTSSAKYISVSINGRTPSGYNTILCGEETLDGSVVASNIQSALRALGLHADDGYKEATCTYDSTTKKFTIQSATYGAKSRVQVTAGISDDCSAILGFDSPTEARGRKIVKMEFRPTTVQNGAFPVRYRVIPVTITEEKFIGGF